MENKFTNIYICLNLFKTYLAREMTSLRKLKGGVHVLPFDYSQNACSQLDQRYNLFAHIY